MRSLLKQDITPRSALAILVLALAVSVIAARDDTVAAMAEPSDAEPAVRAKPQTEDRAVIAYIDANVGRLNRLPREGMVGDLLGVNTPPPPPSAPAPVVITAPQTAHAVPAPPPKPVAPPLPFRYIGRMVDADRIIIFVTRNNSNAANLALAVGDVVENTYKLESVGPGGAVIQYLPLGIKQTLAMSTRN